MTRLLVVVPASLAMASLAASSFAASMEALQGAWIMDGTVCSATFEKQGNEIRFRNRGASTTTGIIISGSKVVGPQMACTAKKIHDEKDHFSAYLSCGDAIMFSGISVSFRIIDHDSFDRFDALFPEESVRYHRCEM